MDVEPRNSYPEHVDMSSVAAESNPPMHSTSAAPSLLELSIVIPAFNEERRLVRTLTETLAFLALQDYASEVLVVDDGSTDATTSIVREFRDVSQGRVRLLQNPGNRGKGFAVRHGVMNSQGRVILFFDADLSTPLSEVRKVMDPIQAGRCDVAIGSRRVSERSTQSVIRRLLGRLFVQLRRTLLGLSFQDTQCGFKAMRRESAHTIFGHQTIEGFAFDVEILMIAESQAWRTVEVPVLWADQPGSKVQPVNASLSMLRDLIRLRVQHGRRRFERFRSGAAVRIIGPDGSADDGFLENVSQGGLLVRSPRLWPLSTDLTVLLPLPNRSFLPLYANVVRHSEESGDDRPQAMGLSFSRMTPETLGKLASFLERV
jgi:dolichyl-phosphate beta-glucosyltransferase